MKASYKQLNVILVLRVRKLDLSFLALKLGKFSFFD